MKNVFRFVALLAFAMILGCEEPPADPETFPDIPAGERSTSKVDGGAVPPKPE